MKLNRKLMKAYREDPKVREIFETARSTDISKYGLREQIKYSGRTDGMSNREFVTGVYAPLALVFGGLAGEVAGLATDNTALGLAGAGATLAGVAYLAKVLISAARAEK